MGNQSHSLPSPWQSLGLHQRPDTLEIVCGVCSEEDESFLDVTFNTLDFLTEHVEADSLGDGSALADCDHIALFETEGWGAVDRDVLVALLESVVLLDVVEVIAADNDSPAHFSCKHDTPIHIIIIKYIGKTNQAHHHPPLAT